MRRPAAGWRARAVVWGAWAAFLLVALACIARWGRNIPLAEDWTLVAPLTGHEASIPRWLWSQNNEHRVPLPRLALLGLLKATGGDFRAGMVANALILAAVAAAMARTAARLRGGYRPADAFFPVLLLHVGNWENLVWGWQLQFTLSVALTCVLLLAAVRAPVTGAATGGRWALAAAAAMVLLPLCGANGLIFALAMAPWALFVAARGWRGGGAPPPAPPNGAAPVGPSGAERRGAVALGAAAVVAVLLVLVYFVGYERPSWVPPNPGRRATVETAGKFAAMAFGPAVSARWELAIAAAVLVLAPTLVLLLARAPGAWRAGGAERARVVGLACFAGGTGVLTLAVGYGRAAYVPTIGMPSRYVLLAAPSLCAAYFVWERYGGRAASRVVPAALCVALVALVPANTRQGFGWRDWYVGGMRAVERDVAAGVRRRELARRHHSFLLHWNEALCASAIGWLRDAGRGPFVAVRD